jgi:hypothetical protein
MPRELPVNSAYFPLSDMRDLRFSVIRVWRKAMTRASFFCRLFHHLSAPLAEIKQSNGAFGSPRQSVFICLHKDWDRQVSAVTRDLFFCLHRTCDYRNYGVTDSSTGGESPPPGEKLVVSFRSFLESVAQAAPKPDPVLVSILRRAPREGATEWHSLGSATQVWC